MKHNGYQITLEGLNSQSHSFVQHLDKIIPDVKRISTEPELKVYSDYGKLYTIQYYLPKSKSGISVVSKDPSFKTLLGFVMMKTSQKPLMFIEVKPNITRDAIIKAFNQINSTTKIKSVYSHIKSTIGIRGLISKINGNTIKEELSPDVKAKLIETLVPMIFALIFGLMFWIKRLKYKIQEHNVETEVERDINNSLFKGQKENDSAFEDYTHLQSFIKQTIGGPYPAIIICGPPGTSKTHMIRRTFYFNKLRPGDDYIIERGATLGLIDVFSLLYRMRDSILVLDDFDTPLQSPDTINFLKSITDSYKRRVLSMPRAGTSSQDNKEAVLDIPQKFEYSGKLIMVTNLNRKDLDTALVSRCPSIEINFSTDRMIKIITKMMKYIHPDISQEIKEEVFNYILKLYKKNKNTSINFRSFQNSVSARIVNPEDWKSMVEFITGYA